MFVVSPREAPIPRILALDVGDARIGLALSDPLAILASPLKILAREDIAADIESILAVVRENNVARIIVGLPLNMDGTQGAQAEKAKEFTARLKESAAVPIEFKDERLTTVEAKNALKASHKNANRLRVDAAAAALILQSYLDEHLPPKELPAEE